MKFFILIIMGLISLPLFSQHSGWRVAPVYYSYQTETMPTSSWSDVQIPQYWTKAFGLEFGYSFNLPIYRNFLFQIEPAYGRLIPIDKYRYPTVYGDDGSVLQIGETIDKESHNYAALSLGASYILNSKWIINIGIRGDYMKKRSEYIDYHLNIGGGYHFKWGDIYFKYGIPLIDAYTFTFSSHGFETEQTDYYYYYGRFIDLDQNTSKDYKGKSHRFEIGLVTPIFRLLRKEN